MSGDDKFDDFLRREAAAYNRPREVPRDEMWERIRAERAKLRGGESGLGSRPPALGSSDSPDSITARPPRVLAFPQARRWALAAAAVLLLVAGIAIGRVFPSGDAPVGVARDEGPVRVPPGPGTPPEQRAEPVQELAATQPSVQPDAQSPSAGAPGAAVQPSPAQRVASTTQQPRAESREPRAGSQLNDPSTTSAHQFALQQHLAHSEALLVAFRAEAREGRLDAEMSRWARDLLSSTRLLLDSPAAGDPRRRRMLEDLELVLVQIVHLAPDATAEDRDDVGRAIEQGDVLTRLRNTAPAGATSSGT